MHEILVVTVKRHPEMSALFVNGTLVYCATMYNLNAPKAAAVAHNLTKALRMRPGSFRSVNIPYKKGMTFDSRTYIQARRYLSYRDKATEQKRRNRAQELALVG